jgi:hypothetical protein
VRTPPARAATCASPRARRACPATVSGYPHARESAPTSSGSPLTVAWRRRHVWCVNRVCEDRSHSRRATVRCAAPGHGDHGARSKMRMVLRRR